jgi:hypothetical protein
MFFALLSKINLTSEIELKTSSRLLHEGINHLSNIDLDVLR